MIKKLINKFKNTTLFYKLTIIIIISSVVLSIMIAWAIMNISRKIIINNFSIKNNKIIDQIQLDLSDLNDTITNIAKTVNDNPGFENYLGKDIQTDTEKFTSLYSMKNCLSPFYTAIHSKNLELLTMGINGNTYTGNATSVTTSLNEIRNSDITVNTFAKNGNIIYQYNDKGFTSVTAHDNVIIMSRTLKNNYSKKYFGTLYITMNEKNFKKVYSNFVTDISSFTIVNPEGRVMSSSFSDTVGKYDKTLLKEAKKISESNINYDNITINNRKYIALATYMPIYNFYIVNLIDTSMALNDIFNINEVFLICLLIIVITLIIVSVVVKATTKPISVLVGEMSNITEGVLSKHIDIHGGYEVNILKKSFNYMMDDINNYIEEILEAQQKQRSAEIHALQMQINPHFMYNTLSSIKYLVMKNDYDIARKAIDAFIGLLRNTISNSDEYTTVSQEIENLKNYVFINETRYGDAIKTSFHVFPGCEDFMIPKLILQPFVENAFFHGFEGSSEGLIHVFISEKGNNILCEIIDNGIGMDDEAIHNLYIGNTEKHRHFTGIGVKNVDDRIKLLYGNSYGVKIKSSPGCGTTITIEIPKNM